MLSAPAKIASIWFSDKERAVATTIGSLAGPIGCIVGFVMPIFFVTPQTSEDGPIDTVLARKEIHDYIFWQSVYISIAAAPILFLIRNKPKYPPSIEAIED